MLTCVWSLCSANKLLRLRHFVSVLNLKFFDQLERRHCKDTPYFRPFYIGAPNRPFLWGLTQSMVGWFFSKLWVCWDECEYRGAECEYVGMNVSAVGWMWVRWDECEYGGMNVSMVGWMWERWDECEYGGMNVSTVGMNVSTVGWMWVWWDECEYGGMNVNCEYYGMMWARWDDVNCEYGGMIKSMVGWR